MAYLGSWKIDDYLTFYTNLHAPSTGGVADGDSAPTYRVYEDETNTPILTGSMTVIDNDGTMGFYSERIQLTAANGFEKGKCYCVRILGVVESVTGAHIDTFQMEAEVDSNTVSGAVPSVTGSVGSVATGGITAASIATDAIGASELAADAATEIAAAVWNALRASYTGAGSFGQGVASVQGNVTGSVASVTGAVGSVTGACGSVTGAVGSVTGNVGGNVVGSVGSVTGSVGSVTGTVGSVTGNVGGNVAGSVASVTGSVGSVTGNVGGNVTGSVGDLLKMGGENIPDDLFI